MLEDFAPFVLHNRPRVTRSHSCCGFRPQLSPNVSANIVSRFKLLKLLKKVLLSLRSLSDLLLLLRGSTQHSYPPEMGPPFEKLVQPNLCHFIGIGEKLSCGRRQPKAARRGRGRPMSLCNLVVHNIIISAGAESLRKISQVISGTAYAGFRLVPGRDTQPVEFAAGYRDTGIRPFFGTPARACRSSMV